MMQDYRQIDWHEGMVLTQQHFQQSLIANSLQLAYVLKCVNPYGYGILEYNLDHMGQTFFLKKITCIMPDYSIVTSAKDCSLQTAANGDLWIYLCVDEKHEIYRNGVGRYVSQFTDPIADIHNPSSEQSLSRLTIKPFLSEHPTAVSFPIARFEVKMGQFERLPYDPPSPYLSRCKNTHAMLMDVLEQMRLRYRRASLKSETQNRRDELDAYGYALSRGILILFQIIENDTIGPFTAYNQIIQAASHLIGVIEESFPRSKYEHTNIYSSFEQIVTYMLAKLKQIDSRYPNKISRFRQFMLSNDFANNQIAFQHETSKGKISILLYMNSEYVENARAMLICNIDDIETLLMKRLKGLERQIVRTSEAGNESIVEITIEVPDGVKEIVIIPGHGNAINKVYMT